MDRLLRTLFAAPRLHFPTPRAYLSTTGVRAMPPSRELLLPSFRKRGGANRPRLKSYNAPTLANIGARHITQSSDLWSFWRTSENAVKAKFGERRNPEVRLRTPRLLGTRVHRDLPERTSTRFTRYSSPRGVLLCTWTMSDPTTTTSSVQAHARGNDPAVSCCGCWPRARSWWLCWRQGGGGCRSWEPTRSPPRAIPRPYTWLDAPLPIRARRTRRAEAVQRRAHPTRSPHASREPGSEASMPMETKGQGRIKPLPTSQNTPCR
jgi:hypothetical protein